MLSEQQRSQWRSIAIFGIIGNILSFVSLSVGSVMLGLGAGYLNAAFKTARPPRLFENAEPSDYPMMGLLLILVTMPFTINAIFVLLKYHLIDQPGLFVLRQIIYINIMLGITLSPFIIITNLYAELYAANDTEFRMWMAMNRLVVYLFFIAMPLAEMGIGFVVLRTRFLPYSLGMISIIIAIIGLIVNFFMLNTDLPAVRIVLNVPIFTVSNIIWVAYLWLLTIPLSLHRQDDTPTTIG